MKLEIKEEADKKYLYLVSRENKYCVGLMDEDLGLSFQIFRSAAFPGGVSYYKDNLGEAARIHAALKLDTFRELRKLWFQISACEKHLEILDALQED